MNLIPERARALTSSNQRIDYETETLIAHALKADGFDASEDGTGRGTPITLAIRGRGDSHDLECRQDGLANAVLTPNGGRGWIGVGAVAFTQNQREEVRELEVAGAIGSIRRGDAKNESLIAFDARQSDAIQYGDKTGPLDTHAFSMGVQRGMQVRRLTPRECERLQGFPDDYTLIPHRSKPAADGPRYKALGNSMAVPVVRWIGERIATIHALARNA